MNVYLAGALSGLSYISYPITILLYSILLAVLWLANVLYGPVAAFLQPFIFIILCIWRVVALPFRLLAQLEVRCSHGMMAITHSCTAII